MTFAVRHCNFASLLPEHFAFFLVHYVPFRSTLRVAYIRKRWTLAAIYFPEQPVVQKVRFKVEESKQDPSSGRAAPSASQALTTLHSIARRAATMFTISTLAGVAGVISQVWAIDLNVNNLSMSLNPPE